MNGENEQVDDGSTPGEVQEQPAEVPSPAEVPPAEAPPPAPSPADERLARLEGQLAQLTQQNQYLASIAFQRGGQAGAPPEEPPDVPEDVRRYVAQERAQSERSIQAIQERLDAAEFQNAVMSAGLEKPDVEAALQRYQSWQQSNMLVMDASGTPRRLSAMDALRFHLGNQALSGKKGGAGAGSPPSPGRAPPKVEPVVTERPGRTAVAPKAADPDKMKSSAERLEKFWYKELDGVEF